MDGLRINFTTKNSALLKIIFTSIKKQLIGAFSKNP